MQLAMYLLCWDYFKNHNFVVINSPSTSGYYLSYLLLCIIFILILLCCGGKLSVDIAYLFKTNAMPASKVQTSSAIFLKICQITLKIAMIISRIISNKPIEQIKGVLNAIDKKWKPITGQFNDWHVSAFFELLFSQSLK